MNRRSLLKLLSTIFLINHGKNANWNFKNGSQIKFHKSPSPYSIEDKKDLCYGIPYYNDDGTQVFIRNGKRE